ncbi:leucine-rich repeat-containing protein 61 isoform X1 [Thunnus thynnus]|uniref:leucine-rich repeat-containing protein 61 isoform X1 n=1 Tax=Thunnus maccoyii TaxID=8240 RepID=UPI001C4CE9AE|nr:leucine-rich repeat-containing protein 61 isoform X1 [Thunnus maccoyii]
MYRFATQHFTCLIIIRGGKGQLPLSLNNPPTFIRLNHPHEVTQPLPHDAHSHETDAECEKITAVLLKSRTGEFDLESILFLKLRGLGIHDLGCIGECMNLERLDLSANNITNLAPLSSLRLLSVLNLSANRISNLEPLHSCDNLQNLNLAGNIISSIESLHYLQSLRKLENIRLKDNTYNYTNPVCRNTPYRTIVLEMFPTLKVLDGERVVGRGSDLYQLCKDIDDTIKAGLYKNGQLIEHPDCKPWVEDTYWEIKRSNNAIIEEAYKQFNDVLHECRLLNNRATHVISQTERSMSLKKQPKQYAI